MNAPLLLALPGAALAAAAPVRFARHVIAEFPGVYQVAVADLDRDGRPDVAALATESERVEWYRNPDWERHAIARTPRNIDMAAHDLDGDGWPEIALAYGFYFGEADRGGDIAWLRRPAAGAELWELHPVAVDPVAHRLRWADLDGDGRAELVHAPIFGRGSQGARAPTPARLCAFRPPAASAPSALPDPSDPSDPSDTPWTPWCIDETLTVLHGLHAADLDGDGRDELLTASFEGIHRFDWDGAAPGGAWRKARLARGFVPESAEPGASRGTSEVVPGRLRAGGSFLAAIEPWHGRATVIYTPASAPGEWARHVLDEGMTEGHALVAADLDGDGGDEVVAGWRGAGGGLALHDCRDDAGERWRRAPLDDALAVEGLVAADLNGDGRTDLVAGAGRPGLVVWYENLGPAATPRAEAR